MSPLLINPPQDDDTCCVHHPEIDETGFAAVTVPVWRASTIVFPDMAAYAARNSKGHDAYSYGLHGTPTTRTLEAQIARLEGGGRSIVTSSGLSAITMTMQTMLSPGDTVLLVDTVYPPVREFADRFLRRMGIDIVYYDPAIGAGIAELITATTRLVWMESPGSTTMEVQDIPAIVAAARARGVPTAIDNTWATPLLLKPLELGVDIVIQAVSKYMAGHSDLLMGAVTVRDLALFDRLRTAFKLLGHGVSPDDCSLVLRGLETLAVRLRQSSASALDLARMLEESGRFQAVLHPALPSFAGHAIWKRDFKGASGVFSVVLKPESLDRLPNALSRLRVFAIGASWGGTHSLVAPMDITAARTATACPWRCPIIRLSVGMEGLADLRADLQAFAGGLTS